MITERSSDARPSAVITTAASSGGSASAPSSSAGPTRAMRRMSVSPPAANAPAWRHRPNAISQSAASSESAAERGRESDAPGERTRGGSGTRVDAAGDCDTVVSTTAGARVAASVTPVTSASCLSRVAASSSAANASLSTSPLSCPLNSPPPLKSGSSWRAALPSCSTPAGPASGVVTIFKAVAEVTFEDDAKKIVGSGGASETAASGATSRPSAALRRLK